jgi:hypothetical protein
VGFFICITLPPYFILIPQQEKKFLEKFDLFGIFIIKENIDNEKFQSNEKRILDSIFQTCVSEKSNMLARLS